MLKEELPNLKYTPSEIESKTREIYSRILAQSLHLDHGNFTRIGCADLADLFDLYDRLFFEGFFKENYAGKIGFRLSQRMTRAGGKTSHQKARGAYELFLSTFLVFQTFSDVQREISVGGIVCRDRLEATMRILEHEIIHLLEYVLFGESSCSQARFSRLVQNLFNHTATTHRLVTQPERVWATHGLRVGDGVTFEFDGTSFRGIIARITKRATVIVPDPSGEYQDGSGNRYRKYYVPTALLTGTRDP